MQHLNMTTTGVIIIACSVVLLAWEVVAFVSGRRQALVSSWMQRFGFRSPLGMLSLGVMLGHCFAYFPPVVDGEKLQCPACGLWIELKSHPDGSVSGLHTEEPGK
jgi:hypothetical protein